MWLMAATVAILAVAVAAFAGALDADAKKKKKKKPAVPITKALVTQTVESTVALPNTGSCDAGNGNCTGEVTTTANCPAGFKVTGGGIRVGQPSNDFVEGSYQSGNGWTAVAFRGNNKTGNSTLTAVAVCAQERFAGIAGCRSAEWQPGAGSEEDEGMRTAVTGSRRQGRSDSRSRPDALNDPRVSPEVDLNQSEERRGHG
jgi:hypothetical protein